MKQKIIVNARFIPRAKTLKEWEEENPILLAGEHGVVTQAKGSEREKIGDGVTPWNELDWWRGASAYEIAVTNGFDGTEQEWLASLKGDKCDDIIIDQNYNVVSTNAQSGIAVAEAIKENNATIDFNYLKKANSDNYQDKVYCINTEGETITPYLEDNDYFENGLEVVNNVYKVYGDIPRRQSNGNLMTNTPIKDLDCTNKKYVDDAISNVESGGADLSNYYTKTEVDNKIGDIETPLDEKIKKIAREDATNIDNFSYVEDRVPYFYGVYKDANGNEQQGLIKSSIATVLDDLAQQQNDPEIAEQIKKGIVPITLKNSLGPRTVVVRDYNIAISTGVKSGNVVYYGAAVPLNYMKTYVTGQINQAKDYTDNKISNIELPSSNADNWELINKITTTEDVKRIMCTADSSGNEFLLKKVVFIVRSQPSANADGNATLYYLISTSKTRTDTSTGHQIGELGSGLRTTAQNNSAYVERKCYIPSAKNNNSNGVVHFDITTGEQGNIKPKYQIRDILATRDEEYITCAYVESGSDTTIFGADTELEIWGVRA